MSLILRLKFYDGFLWQDFWINSQNSQAVTLPRALEISWFIVTDNKKDAPEFSVRFPIGEGNMKMLRNEDGAALISVLLLVSVMSVAMVAMFDMLGFYTKRTVSNQDRAQAIEYAKASELIGGEQAVKLAAQQNLLTYLGANEGAQKVNMPIQNGMITGELIERTNCFNLSSLVTVGSSGEFEINIATYQQFVRLLVNVGIGERAALSLASALVDWQDSNSRPEPGGAEDFTYSQLEIPYGAANAPIMDIDELRLVNGFTPELIDVLRLYTCVDPVSMETIINLNSVEPKDAVLLHALLGISNSIQSMEMVINERSANGYDNVARFWDHRFLKDEEINQNIRKQFTISPKRYSIVVDVKLDYTNVHMESLILINNDGTYSLIDRKLGA